MAVHELGYSATSSGWRKEVADVVAPRAPVAERHARALLGLLFLGLSVRYVVQTVRNASRR